ncbi:PREDICTED: 50S ribosomal protein 6, chloroplastic-like [Camelina sativa]|uniref:50S ribosomal protein 6, chloroplastic-like n=1 Tax=Camelina sativa TaxID=90675 RepID=A0ABM0XYB6_CAMSA|nr:PREDICTED: 50S ribosomal protein 6, chloroplastic-like [Camelina sativa]
MFSNPKQEAHTHFFSLTCTKDKETMSVSAIFGTGIVTVAAASPVLRQFQVPKLGNGGGGLGMVIECSSRPQKKSTAHHRKSRPKKTQPWDVKRKPTVYAPLPPLPAEWTPFTLASDDGGAAAAASPAGDLVPGAA